MAITRILQGARRRIVRLAQVSPLLLLFGAFVAGILFWGAFNWSMALTNSEAFCISCHEMSDNVYREYQRSVHYENGSGVRATCPDCHVPHEWTDMVVRKVRATNELFHTLVGSIDTREKFLAKRWELADIVWTTMEHNNSLECRNCHEMGHMKTDQQTAAAAQAHRTGSEQGLTCIACHKGVVHELPEEFIEHEHQRIEEEGIACTQCHASLHQNQEEGGWY